jgi:hypothetical protein
MDQLCSIDAKPTHRRRPVPTNRRCVAEARAAPRINKLPSNADLLPYLINQPHDKDARVPKPLICGNRRLVAYSQYLYEPDTPLCPPQYPGLHCFSEYEDWLLGLTYRSNAWKTEHDKYVTASMVGTILGLDRDSPEKAWKNCVCTNPDVQESAFGLFIMERGVQYECLHHELFRIFDPCHDHVTDCGSQLHPTLKWIMATPDMKMYERDPITGVRRMHIADAEFKTPWSKNAYTEVPAKYMAQVQVTMEVDDVDVDYFSTLRIDDKSLHSEWIVIKVYRSREYWKRALPVMADFCRAVLTATRPPPRGCFVEPVVKTEMVIRLIDPLDKIPDWKGKIGAASMAAHANARETACCRAESSAKRRRIDADTEQQIDQMMWTEAVQK